MTPSESLQVAGRIRHYILHNELKPGDILPVQHELSRQLNIGHRRLREGMSVLKDQGLVETRRKGGTIVCQPSFENLSEPIGWHLDTTGHDFEDLILARACVESGATAEAADKRTARDLLVMLDILEQMEAVLETTENELPRDEQFHCAILEATHNPVIVAFGQIVRLQFLKYAKLKSDSLEGRRETYKAHKSIYEAIRRKDRAGARDLMYAHVMVALNNIEDGNCC